ncbi:MAG TPA: winged helix-turn-helix domain-containing protein [Dehalococcoidia bacterium]|jgi:two-component system response regulator VicR|nr:winged helix-turn-helix domain-containing protein [Dehalococcoidia bacterium]
MSNITLGNLTIDRNRVAVWVAGRPVALTYIEFELLFDLARHAGQVRSRQKLMQTVWREPASSSDRKLTVHMSRLRSKLKDSSPWQIQTYTRRGYGLMDSRVPAQAAS